MARTLYTLGYPNLDPEDRALIDAFRSAHDLPLRDLVKPHFTLAFSCSDLDEHDYLAHAHTIAAASKSISFTCRYAMLGADHADDTAYVFLVPDEGHSAIALLHDRLYTGILAAKLRLDVPYIPHITIATQADRAVAKALCVQWNARGLSISGSLTALSVSSLQNSRIHDLEKIPLAAD